MQAHYPTYYPAPKRTSLAKILVPILIVGCAILAVIIYAGLSFLGIIPRYEWERNDTGVTITGYRGQLEHINIPSHIRGRPVTEIGHRAFEPIATVADIMDFPIRINTGSDQARSITIPSTVTHIENWAFADLEYLEYVYIPYGVTHIGDYAFQGCASLKEIVFPDSVVHIGDFAFQNCISLTEVVLPPRLAKVNRDVFRGCTNLRHIVIPDGITEIGRGAFAITGIKEIDIPVNVAYIGGSAFARADNLESITIPPGVTTIYGNTFYNATNLRYIYYSDTLERVGHNAFTGTPWLEEGGFEIMKQQLRDWGEQ